MNVLFRFPPRLQGTNHAARQLSLSQDAAISVNDECLMIFMINVYIHLVIWIKLNHGSKAAGFVSCTWGVQNLPCLQRTHSNLKKQGLMWSGLWLFGVKFNEVQAAEFQCRNGKRWNIIQLIYWWQWKPWPSGHGGHTLLPWGRAAWVRPRQPRRTKRTFFPP